MDATRPLADRSFDDTKGHLLPRDAEAGERGPAVLDPASPRAIEWTAERLVDGGIVAIPTDTVYGVAASLAHEAAIARLYDVKGRPADRVLPVLVSSYDALSRIALDLDERVALLLGRYWPGPLTFVVPAREGMPAGVVAPDGTVGVRMPNHPLALEVIEKAGGAIACTSANRSGAAPARTAAEAAAIGPGIDIVLDGGVTPGGVPSTVVAVRESEVVVLRQGAVPAAEIAAEWQSIRGARG